MGATARYGIPYPEKTDPVNIPIDLQELATQVDDALNLIGNRPRCILLRTTEQVIPDSSWQVITFASAENDPFNMHTDGSGDIILPTIGYWMLNFQVAWPIPNAVGRCEIAIAVAGVRRANQRIPISGSGAGTFGTTTSALIIVTSAPVTIQGQAYQAAQGASWGPSNGTRLSAIRLAES